MSNRCTILQARLCAASPIWQSFGDNFVIGLVYTVHKGADLSMPIADASYTSYLLRLWCAQQADGHTWIACVQSTATGERRWFPNLEALAQFFRDEFEDEKEADSQPVVTGTTTVP